MTDLLAGFGRFITFVALALLTFALWTAWKEWRVRREAIKRDRRDRMIARREQWICEEIARLPVKEGTPDD